MMCRLVPRCRQNPTSRMSWRLQSESLDPGHGSETSRSHSILVCHSSLTHSQLKPALASVITACNLTQHHICQCVLALHTASCARSNLLHKCWHHCLTQNVQTIVLHVEQLHHWHILVLSQHPVCWLLAIAGKQLVYCKSPQSPSRLPSMSLRDLNVSLKAQCPRLLTTGSWQTFRYG